MKLTHACRFFQFLTVGCLLVEGLAAGTVVYLPFPSDQWGTQNYSVMLSAPGTGSYQCSGSSGSPDGCTVGRVGTSGSASDSANGSALAYNDQNGIHVSVTAGSSENALSFWDGQPYTYADSKADGYFWDTLTNDSGQTATIQIGFHVDGQLTIGPGTQVGLTGGANDYATLDMYLWDGVNGANETNSESWFNSVSSPNIYSSNRSLSIDQDYLTHTVTLTPGAYYSFAIEIAAEAWTETEGDGYTLSATSDASNTLSITSFSAFDPQGNPLPAGDFSSQQDINYGQFDSSGTPEPAPCGLLALSIGALLVRARRSRHA